MDRIGQISQGTTLAGYVCDMSRVVGKPVSGHAFPLSLFHMVVPKGRCPKHAKLLYRHAQMQMLLVCAWLFAGAATAHAVQNVILPANGGVLDSFTGEFDANFSAAHLTNGITDEAGWSSPRKPRNPYEFVYSFNGGNLARLTEAVIHGGTGQGQYYSKNVEVWVSADGVAYTMAGSGILAASANQALTIGLNDMVVKNIKLVVTSGHDKNLWQLGEFMVNGVIVYPLVVDGGTGDGNHGSGAEVSIQADVISGQTFASWIVVSGTPLIADLKNPNTILIMPSGGSVVAASYNFAPNWTASPIITFDAQETAAFSQTLGDVATDPEGDRLIFSKVGGPAWLSVANNGDLSGTPGRSDVGVNSCTVALSDGANPSVLATIEIRVAPTAFTAWAINQGVSSRTEDEDGDGYNNEFEYLMGLNPRDATNSRLPALSMSAGRPAFTYTFRTDAAIAYRVLSSTDLKTWLPADVTPGIPQPNGNGTSTITVTSNVGMASAPKQFFVLEALEQ